jgi:hypothetical protein
MKQRVAKIEHFWDGLTVRKTDQDRELQRRVVLGADALVRAICKGILRGIVIGIMIMIALYAIQQYQPGRIWGFHNGRLVPEIEMPLENGRVVEGPVHPRK